MRSSISCAIRSCAGRRRAAGPSPRRRYATVIVSQRSPSSPPFVPASFIPLSALFARHGLTTHISPTQTYRTHSQTTHTPTHPPAHARTYTHTHPPTDPLTHPLTHHLLHVFTYYQDLDEHRVLHHQHEQFPFTIKRAKNKRPKPPPPMQNGHGDDGEAGDAGGSGDGIVGDGVWQVPHPYLRLHLPLPMSSSLFSVPSLIYPPPPPS